MKFYLAILCLSTLTQSCATAFHSPEDTIWIHSDRAADLQGLSVFHKQKPLRIESLEVKESKTQDFGRYTLSQNRDHYVSGPGLARIRLDRSLFQGDLELSLEKPGAKPQKVLVKREITLLYYANIFNIIGFFIDLQSGFMWDYSPDSIKLELTKELAP